MNGKTREFWETNKWKERFAPPTTPAYQAPQINIPQIQAGALGPLRAEYEAAVPKIGARLAKMGMGRSGRRFAEEGKLLGMFMTQAGAITSDIALRGAQLEIEAAKVGLTADQFEKKLRLEKEQFYKTLSSEEKRWLREQELREKESELEAEKFDWTKEEFQQRIAWEQDMFNRTLSSEDRRFDEQMELRWREQELSETEIENKKQMFYDQLKQYEEQFNREIGFKEAESLREYELALKDQGLTQQQIDNQMLQFSEELEFQQDRFNRTFNFEETKWIDEFALATEQALFDQKLSRDQFKETIRQFDAALKESGKLERSRLDLERTRNEIMNNEIFGYFDEKYGPGSENPPPDKYTDPPEYDDDGNLKPSAEWTLYMDLHYHPGALDLKEWAIRLDELLGLRGVSNVEPTEPRELGTYDEIQAQIDTKQQELAHYNTQANAHTGDDPWWSTPEGIKTAQMISELQSEITQLEADQEAWIKQQQY